MEPIKISMTTSNSSSKSTASADSVTRIILVLTVAGAVLGLLSIGARVIALVYMDRAYPMTVDSAYADRAAAEADNLFGRGWMPRDLPTTMNDVRIRTDVDINLAWAAFRTDDAGIEDIRSQFKRVPTDDVALPGKPGVDWWPSALMSDRALRESGLEVYACGNRAEFSEAAYLAVDAESGQVYYWLR